VTSLRARLAGSLAAVSLLGPLGVLFVFAAPATASTVPAGFFPCPPGAPENSSVCSVAGWQVAIYEGTVTQAQAAAAGVVTSAVAGTSVTGAAAVAGTAVTGIGIAGVAYNILHADTSTTDLAMIATVPSGWAAGVNTTRFGSWIGDGFSTYDLYTTLKFDVVAGTWIMGQSAVLTVQYSIAEVVKYNGYMNFPNNSDSFWIQEGTGVVSVLDGNPNLWQGWTDYVVGETKQFQIQVPVGVTALKFGKAILYPDGHDLYQAGQAAGLNGQMVSTIQCLSASGALRSEVSVTEVSGVTGSVADIGLPAVSCGAGEVLAEWVVDWVTSTGTQNVYNYSAPSWVRAIPVEYPGCVDGGCQVSLWQIVSGSPSLWCGAAAIACPQWWVDPDKAQHYECRYGTYAAPLGLCGVFRDPGNISPNTTLRVTTEGTIVGTSDPVISTDPDAYLEIDTLVKNPTPDWDPDPVPDLDPDPDPIPSLSSSDCFPHGYGAFNPLEWIYRPTVCALSWAFVPTTGVTMVKTETVLDDSVVGGVRNGLGHFLLVAWPGVHNGCEPLYVGTPSVFKGESVTVTPCGTIPLALAAVIRPLLVVLFWLAGILLSVEVVLKAFDIDLMLRKSAASAE